MFIYCPKCKSNLENNNRHYSCAVCGFDYYTNPAPAAGVILVNDKKQIYLIKRALDPSAGLWQIPGGFIDFNESAEAAAKREIKEELGIDLNNLKIFGTYPNEYLFKEIQYFPLDIFFIAEIKSAETILLDKREVLEGKFFNFVDIPFNGLAFASNKKILKDYLDYIE